MRVHAIPAGRDASANLRVVWPAATLATGGHDVKIGSPEWRLDAFTDHGRVVDVATPDCDVLVFQRLQLRGMVEAIPLLQAKGIAVVVDVDDDFAATDPANIAWSTVHPRNDPDRSWAHLATACRSADLVTVTTPALARVYGAHGRVRVIPNRLPRQVLSIGITRTEHDPLRVGWSGDIRTHPNDLQITRGAVGRVLADRDLTAVNVGPGGIARALNLRVPEDATGFVEARAWYTALAENLDIGISPLADTRFNAGKSALRLLELSSVGVPCVASPTPDNVRLHDIGMGVLARKPKDWARELARLIDDAGWRADVTERSLAAAATETLEAHADAWWDAWAAALDHRRETVAA